MENQLARERNLGSPPRQVTQPVGVPDMGASPSVSTDGHGTLFQLPDDPRSNRYPPLLVSDASTLYYSLAAFSSVARLSPTPLLQIDPYDVGVPIHGLAQDSLIEPQRKILGEVKVQLVHARAARMITNASYDGVCADAQPDEPGAEAGTVEHEIEATRRR